MTSTFNLTRGASCEPVEDSSTASGLSQISCTAPLIHWCKHPIFRIHRGHGRKFGAKMCFHCRCLPNLNPGYGQCRQRTETVWQMPREALSAPWPWQHETWKIRPLSRLSVVLRAHRLCAFIHLVVRRPMRWTEWSLIISCYRANILTLLALDLAGHTAHFSVRRINHRVDPRSKHTETTLTLYHFQATNESYDMLWPLPDPCCRFVSEFQIVSVFPASSAPTICQVAGGRCMADAWPLRSLATPILYNTTHPRHLYIHTHIYKYI